MFRRPPVPQLPKFCRHRIPKYVKMRLLNDLDVSCIFQRILVIKKGWQWPAFGERFESSKNEKTNSIGICPQALISHFTPIINPAFEICQTLTVRTFFIDPKITKKSWYLDPKMIKNNDLCLRILMDFASWILRISVQEFSWFLLMKCHDFC